VRLQSRVAPSPVPRSRPEQASILTDRPNHRREPALTDIMSDAFDYFRAYAVRALCKARSMPRGRMKHLMLVAGRIYNLLKKEAAYGPNTQHLEDFRAAQKLERSLDRRPGDGPPAQSHFAQSSRPRAGREVR
jgi:hypothetical protein